MTPERGNPARTGIDASPSGGWLSSSPLSPRVPTLPSRANCAVTKYQREVVLGPQTTSIPQRVWEIRVDSVLKLDCAAKGASDDNSHAEVPR